MKQIFTGIVLATFLLPSCRSLKKKNTKVKDIDTVTVRAFSNPMNIYREASPLLWNITNTRVALSFDYKNKTAKGTEWICLQPYYYPADSLTLDAKSMNIESVTIGQSEKILSFRYDSLQLHIRLDKLYTKEEKVRLTIKYTALPYAQKTGGSAAITDDRGLYFINSDNKIPEKPVQIWTQGETESNSHWLPTIDKPNMRTPVQLELTVPRQYKTLSNGTLISNMENGATRTDIWKMEKPIQVYAIMFAIGDFSIVKEQWKGMDVHYYVEPAYAPNAKKMFQHTPEMIGFFSDVTGIPYPWNKYSQVVVRDYVSGAMENTSASLFGEFMNQDDRSYADGNNEDVVSHELFHQWFGDYVTAESWSNLTVNESFATYGEYLWRKHKYGLSYADELAWSDLQRYLNSSAYSDPVLVRFHYRDKEEMFDRISYQKGGAVLHYLHQLAGDSAFYKSMQLYLSKNALKSAEATHWRLAVEDATGKGWNWFFDEFYHRAGHPELNVDYRYDDAGKKLTAIITQKDKGNLYLLPLKTMIISGTEKNIIDWKISKTSDTFVYEYKNGIRPVIIPDVVHVLPGSITENKTYKEWLVQINNAEDFVSQLLAIKSIQKKDMNNADVKSILQKAINHKTAALREAGLQKISLVENEDLRAIWKSDIVNIAHHDGNNMVRALAFSLLGDWKIKDQQQLIVDAVHDSSYLVAGNALIALSKINDTLAYRIAKENVNGRANTNLDTKAWVIIAGKANDADTALLRSFAANKNDADKRKHMASDLAAFAINTKNEQSYEIAVNLLADKISEVEYEHYRVMYATYLDNIKSSLNTKEKKTSLYQYKLQKVQSVAIKLKESEKDKDIIDIYENILK